MTLTFFMACAHLAAWRWLTTQRKIDLAALYVAAGLAFNIKGPVGVILPFAATAAYLVLNQRRHDLKRLFSPTGAVLLLAIITPWYIALMAQLGLVRMLTMMGKETAGRIFSLDNSPIYYLPILLLYFAPWTWFSLTRLKHWLQRNRRQAFLQTLKQSYPFIWFATYVLFYSIFIGEKHQWYSLQWALPLAILCVQTLMPSHQERPFRRTYRLIGVVAIVFILASVGFYWLLGDIAYSAKVASLLSILSVIGILSMAFARTPAARIRSVAVWFMVMHCVFFQAVLPSTQLRPVTQFAIQLQQQQQPFELLIHERYFHKKLFLFDIPNLTLSELERHSGVFEAKLREQRPAFALCRKSVMDAMDMSLQNSYEIFSSGYCKKEKEREKLKDSRLTRWMRFIQTGDETQIIEPIYLLRRTN